MDRLTPMYLQQHNKTTRVSPWKPNSSIALVSHTKVSLVTLGFLLASPYLQTCVITCETPTASATAFKHARDGMRNFISPILVTSSANM